MHLRAWQERLVPRQGASRDLPAWPSDDRLSALLAWIAVALVAAEFLFIPLRTTRLFPGWAASLMPGRVFHTLDAAPPELVRVAPWWGDLAMFAWWAFGMLVLWIAVPRLLLTGDGRQRFTVLLPWTWRAWAPYLLLAALMLPVLAVASLQSGFVNTYPMLRPAQASSWSWTVLGLYWLCYAAILASVEYLFRGALLFGLESRLGINAAFVSVLPYCLIHVHKPMLEALGSIIAGIVLGVLALRTRSIGGGILVHVLVAIGMDSLALWRTGTFPRAFWP